MFKYFITLGKHAAMCIFHPPSFKIHQQKDKSTSTNALMDGHVVQKSDKSSKNEL